MAGHLRGALLVSEPLEDVKPTIWVVDVYLVQLLYGGPEEGGWWYQSGELCRDPEVLEVLPPSSLGRIGYFASEEAARESREHVQDILDETVNSGRPHPLWTGRYVARLTENYPELGFPKERPHYE